MPGRVARMYVDEGSRVSKGQQLLELESDYVRLNLQRAQADSARAKAMLDEARRDVERKKGLIATNAIPQATMDRSQSTYDQASAAYSSAQAQASLLRQQVADSVVRSPIDGVVAAKRTDVGQRLGDNTVAVANGAVGAFLTGPNGMTLYTFAADSANTTACTGACATKWPPFVLQGTATVKAGDGVTGTLATFARPDGAMQVTYNGIPLYYYSGDTKAGDTNGQGLFGKWFVASPTGAMGSPAPSASSGGGGY